MWKEHWPALLLFLAAEDCWIYAGMGGQPIAFDVGRAEQMWRLAGMKVNPKRFAQVRAIAAAACDEMNKVLAEKAGKKMAQ